MQLLTQIGLFALILAFVGSVIYIISLIYKASKKRGSDTDHIQLYFDEHFRNIVDEWDLMPRNKIKAWKRDMNKKLKVINRDIENIKTKKGGINTRLDTLEKGMMTLEEF